MDILKKITKIAVCLWLVLLFIGSPMVYAGSQVASTDLASAIIVRARYYLNEPTEKFWSDVELLTYLNDGTMDIVARTHCLESVEEKELQVGTVTYPITDPFISIKTVVYESFDEKVINGTMEADSAWADTASAPATNERSTTQVYYGTYSRKFTPDLQDEGIMSTVYTTVTGTTYYYSLFVYPDDETTVNIYIYKGDGLAAIVDSDVSGLTENAWNVISGSYTETVGGAGAYICVRSITGVAAGDWYVDNVSIYSTGQSKSLRRGSIEHMADLSTDMIEPAYWTCWGNDVIVYPAPDSTNAGDIIEVYLISAPIDVASGSAVLVPAHYDKALILYIVSQALKKDRRYAESNAVLAEYLAELDRYRMDYSYQPVKGQID